MEKCEKEERFQEAAIARDRILKLKKMENKKALLDLQIRQNEESEMLNNRYQEEMEAMKSHFDEELKAHEERSQESEENIGAKHKAEIEEFEENFKNSFPPQPKFSPEVLNLQKVMEGHIKNQNYELANECKIKILTLCENQDNKHNKEVKDKKFKSELDKLSTRQKYELNAMRQKLNLHKDEILKRYKQEEKTVNQKFNNKIKDMELAHLAQKNEQIRYNKKNFTSKISVEKRLNRTMMEDSRIQQEGGKSF